MKLRTKSTGFRQRAWDALAERPPARAYASVAALAAEIGANPNGLRDYIAALAERGYVTRREDGAVTLIRHSGPRAPSWSSVRREFRDWNLDPVMSGESLGEIVAASGLSFAAWLRAHGLHEAGSTRLRQMINGQRPVSHEIADRATKPMAS